jgi:6-pyruvoyltetrahydropterin/6-carboxytetrahydropterin synthase
MFELTKEFRFEAAHTLERALDAEPSRRIHGHSYKAEVTLRGPADPATGMVMDVGRLAQKIDAAREALDHRLLDEVPGLGPATLENLCVYIWRQLAPHCTALARVRVARESIGDACSYFGAPAP